MMKVQMAMSDAYYSEQGAARGAQNHLTKHKNAVAKAQFYQKDLVERKEAVRQAEQNLTIAKTALEKAHSDYRLAQEAAKRHYSNEKQMNKLQMQHAKQGEKWAESSAIQNSMQDAFI